MAFGIITKGIGGRYTVFDGTVYHQCVPRGIFRKNKITPLPGDHVEFADGAIDVIQERRNCLIRPAVANVDQLAFFLPVKHPEPDLHLLDKILLTAFAYDLSVLLCINKCDYDADGFAAQIKAVYEPLGIKVLILQAVNGIGIAEISRELTGKITVLAGQSGAGKSTAVNAVFDREVMPTGDVSRKTERGRHTTRHAELLRYEEGFIVDTPGFSSHEVPDYDAAQVRDLYPEFQPYGAECRFKECLHLKEPDCKVKAALESGKIDAGRYERYLRFMDEVAVRKARKYK